MTPSASQLVPVRVKQCYRDGNASGRRLPSHSGMIFVPNRGEAEFRAGRGNGI
jgi:hypothetical protein